MRDDEKGKFAEAMRTLRDCYPSYRPGEEDFRRTMRAYWERMAHLPLDAVASACMHAPDADCYPDYFPSAGQLKRLAEAAAKSKEVERRRALEEATPAWRSPEEELREFHRTVPLTQEGQAAYIAEATSDWDKLARIWACESRALGIAPTDTTPKEIAERRFRDLFALWAKTHEAVE